ncbi:long-chain fatty acid--CoA ligase [Desulfovirgula thermocuniculi]|uniref:long-chain fatty acid--CoA ligase n=1 Tax=Desulfovirgula thermocuniculi TaxID=348842 RepID=UPI0003F6EE3F|nr:long-chain fatty acid--CoA ligase [Desulfovirgula thermocuniculi]
MMRYNLLLKSVLERALKYYSRKAIYSRTFGGEKEYTYRDFYHRVCRLAWVLKELGVKRGARVGTFAWNNHRHLELYFAVPCFGAVLHTINIRLFPEQIAYIINHAEDEVLFIDEDLVPLIEAVADKLATVRHYVIMADGALPPTNLKPVHSYEDLLSSASSETYEFPGDLDEYTPAAMCYTTATTGNPKGVVYTHRALVLHSMAACMVDTLAVCEQDVIMPVVPMFHVNAWGLPFAATMVGATQVLPGPRPDPHLICRLIQERKVTLAAGVPTIWLGCLPLYESGQYSGQSLRAVVVGGSAASRSLIEAYDRLGIPILHAYGMTETTPLVLASRLKSYMQEWDGERKYAARARQGLLVPGLEMRVVNERGEDVQWNGREMGELWLRGPWIAGEYYRDPERTAEAFAGGWLRTGDIVTVDEEGYVAIVDRTKDLVKSGGEWISSVDLENTIMAHPAVQEAAVIGVPHPKWQERPVACVVLKPEFRGRVGKEEILAFLSGKVAKWWLPDEVIFLEEIPKTSVGKFSKRVLRERYAHLFSG